MEAEEKVTYKVTVEATGTSCKYGKEILVVKGEKLQLLVRHVMLLANSLEPPPLMVPNAPGSIHYAGAPPK